MGVNMKGINYALKHLLNATRRLVQIFRAKHLASYTHLKSGCKINSIAYVCINI